MQQGSAGSGGSNGSIGALPAWAQASPLAGVDERAVRQGGISHHDCSRGGGWGLTEG